MQKSAAAVGQQLSPRAAEITPLSRPLSVGAKGICHGRDFYLMLEALEAESRRSSWVGGNSPSRGYGPIAGPAMEPG